MERINVPYCVLFDKSLSLKAKGLYCTMLTLKHREVTRNQIDSVCKESSTAINSALKELVDKGYLIMKK